MRILLVDDQRMMRDGLRAIFEKDGLTVVGEANDGREAIGQARTLRPDVIVMDVSMPELNGADATSRIIAEAPGTKVIGLSMNADRRYVVAMFQAGAVGYLVKTSAASELLQAVREVLAGRKYVSPAVADVVVEGLLGAGSAAKQGAPSAFPGSACHKPLTVREREVLQLLAEGKSSKEIATRLELGLATVETHRRQIMDKLGLRTIAQLTKFAIREGLTSLEC